MTQRAKHLARYADEVSGDAELTAELKLDLASAMKALATKLEEANLAEQGAKLAEQAERLASGASK